MAYKNNILLGRITKVSGYEGAVAVKLEKIFTENIPQMESVFLEIEGRQVPFFISDLEYTGADILKLSFEGYSSIEKISEFIGCLIFLTADTVAEKHQEPDNQSLIGYIVSDQQDEQLGTITRITSNSAQWLLHVLSPQKKEILIPFHENLIISIDTLKKVVIMEIPEGLTEIN